MFFNQIDIEMTIRNGNRESQVCSKVLLLTTDIVSLRTISMNYLFIMTKMSVVIMIFLPLKK